MAKENDPQSSKFVFIDESALERLLSKCLKTELSNLKIGIPEKEDRILFVEDAAAFLGLSKQTVYGLTSQSLIPYYKKGKKLYFRQSDLEQWLNKGRHKSMEELREDAANHLSQKDNKSKK